MSGRNRAAPWFGQRRGEAYKAACENAHPELRAKLKAGGFIHIAIQTLLFSHKWDLTHGPRSSRSR